MIQGTKQKRTKDDLLRLLLLLIVLESDLIYHGAAGLLNVVEMYKVGQHVHVQGWWEDDPVVVSRTHVAVIRELLPGSQVCPLSTISVRPLTCLSVGPLAVFLLSLRDVPSSSPWLLSQRTMGKPLISFAEQHSYGDHRRFSTVATRQ